MFDRKRFELIREKHGQYASWAIWAPAAGRPKSNVGDLSVLDPSANPDLLRTLCPSVVMIGLNISRALDEPFRNFHDPRAASNDYKIRFAFRETAYWGAYMTDVIKGVLEPVSARLLEHLKSDPSIAESHVDYLRTELHDLGRPRPLLLAFGAAAHTLLSKHLPTCAYSRLVCLTHYSHRVSQVRYRDAVLQQIARAATGTA